MNPTPKVDCKYGAPMGRLENQVRPGADAETYNGRKMHLIHVPLNSGGYDRGGAYWGISSPLYWYCIEDNDGEIKEGYFRAGGREDAKDKVREMVPGNWTFYGESKETVK